MESGVTENVGGNGVAHKVEAPLSLSESDPRNVGDMGGDEGGELEGITSSVVVAVKGSAKDSDPDCLKFEAAWDFVTRRIQQFVTKLTWAASVEDGVDIAWTRQ